MRIHWLALGPALLGACGGGGGDAAFLANSGAASQSFNVAASWLPFNTPITMVVDNSHNDYANGVYDLEQAPLTFVRLSDGNLRVVWRNEAFTAALDPDTEGYFFTNSDSTVSLQSGAFGASQTQTVVPVLLNFSDTRNGNFFADTAVSLFGDPTPDEVIHARSVAATYTGTAHLQVIRGVTTLEPAQGSASISVDYVNDLAYGQFAFEQNPGAGLSQDFTATLIGGNLDGASLSGTMVMPAEAVGADSLSTMFVSGGFFGAGGEEIAGQFAGQGPEANFGAFDIKLLGAFSGRR